MHMYMKLKPKPNAVYVVYVYPMPKCLGREGRVFILIYISVTVPVVVHY